MSLQDKTEAFQRKELKATLALCTEEQQAFFHRIYPHGIKTEDLVRACDLCDRTLRNNARLAQ